LEELGLHKWAGLEPHKYLELVRVHYRLADFLFHKQAGLELGEEVEEEHCMLAQMGLHRLAAQEHCRLAQLVPEEIHKYLAGEGCRRPELELGVIHMCLVEELHRWAVQEPCIQVPGQELCTLEPGVSRRSPAEQEPGENHRSLAGVRCKHLELQ
jgi:hypothetical protein